MKRDVIWVTLESFRTDHTTLGGYERDTTPGLARLANSGNWFEDCFSHDIWTRPSSTSILTGHPSSAHQTWTMEASLPTEIETIPEAFAEKGYQTACVSPIPQISPNTGLDRGFTNFNHLTRSNLLSEVGIKSLAKWALQYRNHTGGLTKDGRQHCVGYLTNEVAKREIDDASRNENPLFLYLHHSDSHHPYVPPIAWRDSFVDELEMPIDEAIEFTLEVSANLHKYISMDDPFTDEEWETLKVLYDTCLRYVDHLAEDIAEYAEEKLNNPIIVITADHGELFGEHGLLAHMLVADRTVSNIPMVVKGLENLPSEGPIQHADIMKMICDDLEISHPVPVGKDIRENPREIVITQRGGERATSKLDKICGYNPQYPRGNFHESDLTSILTENWRYQESAEGNELFELPNEVDNVSQENPEVVDDMSEILTKWLESYGEAVGEAGTSEFDSDLKSQLSDLGYLT